MTARSFQMEKEMILFLVLFLLTVSMCQNITISKFSKEHVMCDVSRRVDRECSTEIPKSRSRLHCFSLCGSDKSCIGASLDDNGLCFHHKECPAISGCTVQNNHHVYKTKYCGHGSWDTPSRSCKCVDGFYGDRCQQCPRDCLQLISQGYNEGNHRIYINPDPNGSQPFLVECHIYPQVHYAFVLIAINGGRYDFNRTWLDYVYGFYYDDSHFWAGLYLWNKLSNIGLKRMGLMFVKGSSGYDNFFYREYMDMSVSDESTGFRFTFGRMLTGRLGTIPPGTVMGDCLGDLQNVSFSTWDSDNDNSTDQNCAAITGSGWWYTGCDNPCNVLGCGLQYSNAKPENQIMSLLGVDMNSLASEDDRMVLFLSYPYP